MQIDPYKGTKLSTLAGVREYNERYPVELWISPQGRLTVVAENEGGNNLTQVDFWDIFDWMRLGPAVGRVEGGFAVEMQE